MSDSPALELCHAQHLAGHKSVQQMQRQAFRQAASNLQIPGNLQEINLNHSTHHVLLFA
jgi:hypothetical protein